MRSWVRDLIQWIKKALGYGVPQSALRIIEQYHHKEISVFRLEDKNIPGCCDLWKLERHNEKLGFFLCAIDISRLRTELAERGVSLSEYISQSRSRGVAETIRVQIKDQSRYIASHYFVCGFVVERSGTDSKGRHYTSRALTDVRLIAGDFQGSSGYFAGDRHIQRFLRKIVDQLANDRFWEYGQHRTWKASVKSINWAEWLQGLAKITIAPDHRLQVLRMQQEKTDGG